MKNIKKIAALVITISMLVGLLSGCTATAEGKALIEAMLKTQTIKSSQSDMLMTLNLDATGLSEPDAASFAQVSAMLKDAKLSMNMKHAANEDMTAAKAEVGMDMTLGGMSMEMGVWVDMDYSGSEPRLKEVIKLPSMVFAAVPEMAGKEYIVMDLGDMMQTAGTDASGSSVDYSDLMKVGKELQEKANTFLGSYLAQYDPGFKFISDAGMKEITTPEGKVNAHIYRVSLDDKSAKKLVRYTVNNLADNKDAMAFIKEYMELVQSMSSITTTPASQPEELDKIMADFEAAKPELLAKFNDYMDQLENVQLLGDKGIVIEYAVDEEGFVVNQSTSLNLAIDMAKLAAVMGTESEASGTINAVIDFNTLTYNINKDVNIEMPVLTPENSMDFNEYMDTAMQEAASAQNLTAAPTAAKVLVDGNPVSFDAYTINGSNYFKLRDLAAALKGTPKQFDVAWDGVNNNINLISNKAYTAVGGELVPGDGSEKLPVLNTSAILKDGVQIYLEAYKIDGNSYFKLRDFAQAFNVGITWDNATKTIGIDTASGYVAP